MKKYKNICIVKVNENTEFARKCILFDTYQKFSNIRSIISKKTDIRMEVINRCAFTLRRLCEKCMTHT
jgi:hypothetical protein